MGHRTSSAVNSVLPVLRKIDEVECHLLSRLDRLGKIDEVEHRLLVRLDRMDQRRATCEPGVLRLSRLTGLILASVVLCALAVFAFVILR